jgi:hypothetical protein
MKAITYLMSVFLMAISGAAFANTAADNVRLSAVPSQERNVGNECTNRSIQPFARPKDSTLSDDVLRTTLILVTGAASADKRTAPTSACGNLSTF